MKQKLILAFQLGSITYFLLIQKVKKDIDRLSLYLQEDWVNDKERCLKTKIPLEMIKFQTKHDLGLEVIDNAIKEEIPFSYVAIDGFYGDNPALLNELEKTFVKIPEEKGSRGRPPTKHKYRTLHL